MTLTPADRTLAAWHTLPCRYPTCLQPVGRRCISKSGVRTPPHKVRLDDLDAWLLGVASRDAEVAGLQQGIDMRDATISDANASLRTITVERDSLKVDLQQAAAENTSLTERLARVNADLTLTKAERDALQRRLDDLQPQVETLLKLDLSVVPLGKVTAAGMGKAWGLPGKLAADGNWARTEVLEDSPGGRRWIRQKFAAGLAGQGSGNGISLGVPFPGGERVDKATIAFAVRTSPDFDATYGVKGPGLVGLTPDQTSLTFPSGDKPDPLGQGMSGRFMLFNQKGLSGHVIKHPNECAWYTYHNTLREQYIWSGVTIEPGRAYDLRETIELNDPTLLPAADGIARMEINDQLVIDVDDYDWRKRPDLGLVGIMWSLFRGGPNGDARYAQATESWIDIADGLTVTTPAA